MAVLKLKSKGKDVAALQEALNKTISAKLNADGMFGKATRVAVIKFQKKNSLKADGVAGASTLVRFSMRSTSPYGVDFTLSSEFRSTSLL